MERHDLIKPTFLHKESPGDGEIINSSTKEIVDHIESLSNSINEYSHQLKKLQDYSKLRLKSIKEKLDTAKSIQQDISMLCNKYSDFSSIININDTNTKSTLEYSNGAFSLKPTSSIKCNIEILGVDGNGYHGNKYVMVGDEFVETIIDTKSYKNITDEAINTSFEYSRIISEDKDVPFLFNKDSIGVTCSIEISSDEPINKINISSESKNLVLKEMLISNDGIIYKRYSEYNLKINNKDSRYENQSYVYASGIIAIKPSKFVKMVLLNNVPTSETIAFVKTVVELDKENIEKIIIANKSKRQVIKLNDVSAYRNKYSRGELITDNLIDEQISCIAIVANEYIQHEYSPENSIKYILMINGIEHEVIPINSHRNGIKIIKESNGSKGGTSIKSIPESIKSVKLKISMDSPNADVTPYISDLKLLMGGK